MVIMERIIKGKGASIMEAVGDGNGKVPSEEKFRKALEEFEELGI